MTDQTSSTADSPSSPTTGSAPPPRSTWAKVGRSAVAIFFLASAVLWVYAFFFADSTPKGRLADPSFPEAAEPVCAAALADVDELPPARTATSANARADVVDEATDRLDAMLEELDELVPDDDGASAIRQWLDDWRIYVRDRRDYTKALRDDSSTRFTVTAKYGSQITKSIDHWADINRMPSCETFKDV